MEEVKCESEKMVKEDKENRKGRGLCGCNNERRRKKSDFM